MTYRSKKDTWLIVVMGSSGAVTAVAAAMLLVSGDALGIALGLVTVIVTSGAILCVVPVRYDFENDVLVVHAGLRRWRVAIRNIVDVQSTRDPAASPALSLDRLRITYTKDGRMSFVLISPDDSDAFLNELARRRAGEIPDEDSLRATLRS